MPETTITYEAIAQQRLYHQQLSQQILTTPAEIVAYFGAVQAQEYLDAKWSLSMRLQNAKTDDIFERAFTAGEILRTHIMRPTWHFVAPADIRWLLMLTAPRVHALNAYMYRQLELDDALFVRSHAAIAKALEGGNQLTRAELQAVLAAAGIHAQGVRLAYILHHAELEALICSGGRKGKQFTYALLDERAPQVPMLTPDEALAELVKRYFTSHGPARLEDFAWWSGLTTADAKRGVELVGSALLHAVIAGKSYWFSEVAPQSAPQSAEVAPRAYLLPTYDEYLLSYRDRGAALNPHYAERWRSVEGGFFSSLVIDGQVVGIWKRTIKKSAVHLELNLFRALNDAETAAFESETKRFGEFHALPVVVL